MTIEMEQFHNVFFDESQEHLDTMEQLLMEIDVSNPDAESLNSIFRAAHSIKGGSGIFGFDGLTGLTHVMENLLDKARVGERQLSVDIVNLFLQTVDILKTTLDNYRDGNPINQKEIDQAISLLDETIAIEDESHTRSNNDDGFGFFETEIKADSDEDDGFGFFDAETPTESKDDESFGFFEDLPTVLADSEVKVAPPIVAQAPEPDTLSLEKTVAAPAQVKSAANQSKSIRVDTQKVDLLVNLIGELVITQSMLAMLGQKKGDLEQEKFEQGLSELERNTRELQEAVMSMRMLPISFVFNRFPRLVRDLASKLGKQVDLKIEGGNTEIDKGLIEKLVDPLTHLVRNSIDHGIEMPGVRQEQSKPAEGSITLSAVQRGGSIVISIIDDGAGLNKARILDKAAKNGLPIPDKDNDEAIWDLIFAPGFSTAEAVTDVSGRGVGMDVVKRNIESIGGRITLESQAGKGSGVHIHLPLTLAIVDGMCIASGDQVFVLPLINIIESIQPAPEQLRLISNNTILWVRDKYWPIVDLAKQMDIEGAIDDFSEAIVILIESSKKRFGLKVDRLLGQQQVVIKSLERHYRRIPGAAGATIMGDGQVALILDAESLAENVNADIAEKHSEERNLNERKAS